MSVARFLHGDDPGVIEDRTKEPRQDVTLVEVKNMDPDRERTDHHANALEADRGDRSVRAWTWIDHDRVERRWRHIETRFVRIGHDEVVINGEVRRDGFQEDGIVDVCIIWSAIVVALRNPRGQGEDQGSFGIDSDFKTTTQDRGIVGSSGAADRFANGQRKQLNPVHDALRRVLCGGVKPAPIDPLPLGERLAVSV